VGTSPARSRLRRVESPRHGRGGWTGFVGRPPQHEKGDQGGQSPPPLLVGDGLMQVHVLKGAGKAEGGAILPRAVAARRTTPSSTADVQPDYFMFNNPESACRTCGRAWGRLQGSRNPDLLIPEPGGAASAAAASSRRRSSTTRTPGTGRIMYSLSRAVGFSARHAVGEAVRAGAETPSSTASRRSSRTVAPPEAKEKGAATGDCKDIGLLGGSRAAIERHYRRYRQRGEASLRHGGPGSTR